MMIYLAPLLYTYLLWLLFIVVMALQARWKKLPMMVRILAAPAVLIAVVMDVLFNFTIACVLFMKLPAVRMWGRTLFGFYIPFWPVGVEWTFSQRLGNYKRRADWREPIAHWICANLLDTLGVDGSHCKGL